MHSHVYDGHSEQLPQKNTMSFYAHIILLMLQASLQLNHRDRKSPECMGNQSGEKK